MGSPRSLMILLCLISLAAAETCSGGLALLASRRLLQKGHAQVLEVQTPCAGPSNGWRIRATTSSCGWCWDVNELELLTESGRLGLVDYDWGDWIRDCQPESSGNPDNGRYVPGKAFDGDEGSNWGGRKQTEDYFHLGLRCNNSYVVNKVRILSERATAEEIRIERLEGGIWKHVHLTGQKSNSWETIYECVITSTTSTTTLAIQSSPFAAADGGLNRACRGRNVSDNLPQNYKVTQASTLAQCQMQCLQEPKCQGVEFSSGRCELWIQAVGATAAVPGSECWRYVEPQTRGFFPVDGGFGRACRGASRGDNSPSHYQVVSASSLKICQDRCLGTSGCGGIEYSMGRCELWTRAGGIGASAPVQGFMCLHLLPDFVGVDGGESRVCRGASATDNSMAYYEVVSTRSVQNCTSECRAKTNCQGFEFSLGRCELWIRPEGVGATAEAAGYICMKRLPSTTVTTTGSGAFQFFKFVPIQLRHNGIADAVALSELQLYEGGKAISFAGATATAAGGESVPEEEPGMVLDEDVSTKWLDKNISDLVVQLPQPMKVDAFSFITGNDHSQRDPMQWAILASTDGSSWTNAQLQLSDYETPTMRQAPSHRFAIQAGQWAMRIRAVNTNTGWMWVLHGLQMTTGTGALIEPNAICTPFDSGSAFDGDPYQPWYRDKSGTWKSGELRTEPGFWFGLQCSCPQDVRNVRFLQMCSGHFADEVILEQFQNGAWEPLTVTKAECDDWTVVYNSTAAMPEEKPCPFPVPAVPPVSAPSPEAIPLCQESSTPSEGCMGVTVSEHLMGRFFAQTPGFTVRSSNFCNNRFCLTPMRMSMESCSDRLLLAWTAHLSWEGSTQITVGHELDDCAEMGRLSVSPDCSIVSVLCRSEKTPEQVGAYDFLKATEQEHGGQFGWNEDGTDSMYLFEWEGPTSQEPSAKVHVNHAIGGWKYGHFEAVLDKSKSIYMVQLKTTLGGHEGAVHLAINRGSWTWNRELSQGWACGTGHILANRLTYSESLNRWARFCWTDGHWNGNGTMRDALFWGTMPETGEKNVAQVFAYPRPPSYWEHAGGPTNMIEHKDGWLGIAVGPDPTEGLRVTPGLVSVPGEVRQCEDGTADCTFKWMNVTRLPGKNDYLVGGKLAYANLQRGGDSKDGRLFVGWAGDVGGQRAWGGYYVVETDEKANLYGKVLVLNNTGWGEDNPWTSLPDGCIAMPFVWDEIPGHDYGNDGSIDDGGGFSKTLRISILCPPAQRGQLIQAGLDN